MGPQGKPWTPNPSAARRGVLTRFYHHSARKRKYIFVSLATFGNKRLFLNLDQLFHVEQLYSKVLLYIISKHLTNNNTIV